MVRLNGLSCRRHVMSIEENPPDSIEAGHRNASPSREHFFKRVKPHFYRDHHRTRKNGVDYLSGNHNIKRLSKLTTPNHQRPNFTAVSNPPPPHQLGLKHGPRINPLVQSSALSSASPCVLIPNGHLSVTTAPCTPSNILWLIVSMQ